jgi:hypothetical protein
MNFALQYCAFYAILHLRQWTVRRRTGLYFILFWNSRNTVLSIVIKAILNPLTLVLNPSAQRCLVSYFTGYVVNTYMREKTTLATIIHSVYYLCMVAPTCFGITLPSLGSTPSAFWQMLNWGAVDSVLWMGVLCLVTWYTYARFKKLINWKNN